MVSQKTLVDDLNNICAQTNAQSLCALDIYTTDIAEDEAKFCKLFWDAGFLKKDILKRGYVVLEYGGGLAFNLKDIGQGGYVIPVKEKYKAPVLFSGYETNFDQHTIYHECAHLYQRKLSLFNDRAEPTKGYRKYLHEVHANTFASMVLLLRAENVLEYKHQQLYCLAHDIQEFNQKSKESRFYMSLPIAFELIKAIRRQGHENTLKNFSKDGKIDFEKIALYTAKFVQKYAYTPNEFYHIINNIPLSSYEILKQKAKAWHILGSKYIMMEQEKYQKRKEHYKLIREQRKIKTNQKIKALPEIDEKAKVINAVCAIDILNTHLCQDFGIYTDLEHIITAKSFYLYDIKDEKAKKQASDICDEIAKIHQKWRKNPFFKKLFSKINHPDTRDEVWKLKFKKEREIFQNFQIQKTY